MPGRAAALAPAAPYSVSAYDSIRSCKLALTREIDSSDSHFRVPIHLKGRNRSTDTAAMVDCGATALFLDHNFVSGNHITTFPLRHSIDLFNIDGSSNSAGQITHYARLHLTVDQHSDWTDFLVTDLGGENVILGLPWLRKVNPYVNWTEGWLRTPVTSPSRKATIQDIPEPQSSFIGATTGTAGPLLEETHQALPASDARFELPSNEFSCPTDWLTDDWWGCGYVPQKAIPLPPGPSEPRPPPPIDPSRVPLPDDDEPPLPFQVHGNRRARRAWLRAGRIEHISDQLWCAAGYTYSQQIAEEANRAKPVRTFEEMVPPQYRKHSHIFSEKESERLPEHQPWDHAIDLTNDAPATVRTKVYPMSPNEQQELIRFLEENLRKGYIRPSKSPLASPVFFVKKKDGKLRFVQDYRRLNEFTVKNRYPLPLAADIINRLQGAKYFSKFDVRWGYNNVRIKEGDEWKAAFATNQGLFEPLVMFFGLTNSPATFQALMNSIFADLIVKGKVAVYLDDILIFTSTLEEHREIVDEVLSRLRKHDLYLRPEKCEFEKTEIEYLGLVIREGEVRMDPAKVDAVRNWPTPKSLRDVRGFLGFANFYRRFIKDFSKIARPLNDLTKKNCPWTWGPSQQTAFDTLRNAFTSSPILALWDPSRPTRIEVDASGFATGGVFLQKLDDNLWHPVAFRSASMQPAERNYEIYDREMLAIIEALKDWRHFLEGLPHPFEIVTDHSNLEYWRTAQDLSRRQCRWSLYLSRFNFILVHRPGKANTQADPLSRMPHHRVSDADDNKQQVVLRPEHFAKLAASSMTKIAATTLLQNPLVERIRQHGNREAEVLKALAELTRTGPARLTGGLPDWSEKEGLVFHKGRLYVPPDPELRQAVVRQCHDDPTAGHPGEHGTYELLTRSFWWPQARAFVKKYVEGCETCSRRKHHLHPRSDTQPLPTPDGPWESIGVDLITQLPKAKGYDAIAVFTDHFSKMIHALPCTSDINSEGIADLFYREVFRLHGLPLGVTSDRGPQFASQFTRTLLRRLGIASNLTTAYHPQANGQTERANQEVEKYLRLYASRRQDDWNEHLPLAEFVINSRIHSAHRKSPFEVLYGYLPHFNIPVSPPVGIRSIDDRLAHLQEVRKEVEAALRVEKTRQKEDYEAGKRAAHTFQVGDYVWLSAKNIAIKVPTRKLGDLYLGPFLVTEKIGQLDYRLQLPEWLSRQHSVFHVDKLYPWKGNDINGILPPPPEPIEMDGELEWEVQEVLDSRWVEKRVRTKGRKKSKTVKILQYLVSWTGFNGLATWEPSENLENAQDSVHDFHRRHPTAPQPPNYQPPSVIEDDES